MNDLITITKPYPTKYFGTKVRLLEHILKLIPSGTRTFFEPCGGTGIVSWVLKKRGVRVIINDVLLAAHIRHKSFIENKGVFLKRKDLTRHMGEARKEIFSSRYSCVVGKANAEFLDKLAHSIPRLNDPYKQAIATAIPSIIAIENLKYGAYRFTSYGGLTGFQSLNGICLETAYWDFLINRQGRLIHDNGQKNEAFQMDAIDLIGQVDADVMYFDPPYTTRCGSYEGMMVIYDDWSRYLMGQGHLVINSYDEVADLPPYTRFDIRSQAIDGFCKVFSVATHIPTVIVSYNTTSGIHPTEIENIAKIYGREVKTTRIPYKLPITKKGKDSYTEEVLITATTKIKKTPTLSSQMGSKKAGFEV